MDSAVQDQTAHQKGSGQDEQIRREMTDQEVGRETDEILLTRSLSRELGLDRENENRE